MSARLVRVHRIVPGKGKIDETEFEILDIGKARVVVVRGFSGSAIESLERGLRGVMAVGTPIVNLPLDGEFEVWEEAK